MSDATWTNHAIFGLVSFLVLWFGGMAIFTKVQDILEIVKRLESKRSDLTKEGK
jgi:hypothetical protein